MRQVTQRLRVLGRLPRAAALLARHGRPGAVLYFGESPGDDLLATAVLRQWHAVHGTRAAYLTRYPELFRHNEDVAFTAPYDPLLAGAFQAFGVPRRRLQYHAYDPATDRSVAPRDVHIINLMCESAGLEPIASPLPLLRLEPGEVVRSSRPRVALQSTVLSARMPIANKEWITGRMQQVVDGLRDHAEIVQLGAPADPPLAGVVDLRGRTSIREAAGVLAGSRAFIGMVGFLMHLATAAGTPAVVVFGGREHPDQSGYPQNRNLFTPLACAPCWLWNRCPYDRECLRQIEAGDVIAQAMSLLLE